MQPDFCHKSRKKWGIFIPVIFPSEEEFSVDNIEFSTLSTGFSTRHIFHFFRPGS
jgi:hypothetical protein